MELVKCVSTRSNCLGQLVIGKKYWIDNKSKYADEDGDTYVEVYADEDKKQFIGRLLMGHFMPVKMPLKHGASLLHYVNTRIGFMLCDIVTWCKNNPEHALSTSIMRYINDNNLDAPENQYSDFIVNHVPFTAYHERGKADDYSRYMGYYLYCVEKDREVKKMSDNTEKDGSKKYDLVHKMAGAMNMMKDFEVGYSNPRLGKMIVNHNGQNFLVTIDTLETSGDPTLENAMNEHGYLFK